MRRLFARLIALVGVAGSIVLGSAPPAVAHPLGNFTANTYAGLIVSSDVTRIDYVLDLAEIPTFQTRQRLDADRDGEIGNAEGMRYRTSECAVIAEGLLLEVDGSRAPVRVVGSSLSFPEGQAGLDTLRLECALVAAAGPLEGTPTITYKDATRRDRIGWREVTAVGNRTTLVEQDVEAASISGRLTAYPEDRLASPLDQTTATLLVDPTSGDPAPVPDEFAGANTGMFASVDRLSRAFTGLVTRQDLTIGFGALALVIALALGTLHALAPGHGKTVMAAYLVGRSGDLRQGLLLGVTVAITHTFGVLGLGVLLSASHSLAPERLYPVLGAISGMLFAVVGLTLLRPALSRWCNGHHHDHGAHHHDHDHGEAGGPPAAPRSAWRSLVVPGLAGGLVPSPSALLVLLGGIALGRPWFGVVLVLAYGLGMAATLVGAGWLLVHARTGLERRAVARGWTRWEQLARALPLATACLIVIGGVVMAARSMLAA